jgi:hypothetical protein
MGGALFFFDSNGTFTLSNQFEDNSATGYGPNYATQADTLGCMTTPIPDAPAIQKRFI